MEEDGTVSKAQKQDTDDAPVFEIAWLSFVGLGC